MADGFETTACLEWRQILTVLYMAGCSALKLENRYYLCNFPALFQKGAFRHAFLVLFISMLVFLIVKYKISKFSYWRQAYDRALQRNQHNTQLLSGEKGGPSKMVDSWFLYVNQKEWQEYDTPCLFIKKLFAVSIPCAPKGAHRPGLLTLSHWEMTTACHFWLQILDFYKWKPVLLKSLINGCMANFRI